MPLVLVALGVSVVVRCEVQRLRRWPGVAVTLWRWRRTETSLNKGETYVSGVSVGVSFVVAFWASEGYGWGWFRLATFVLVAVTTTAPAMIHNWYAAGRASEV